MEVVGVIAAVPELVRLVQRVAIATGQISSKSRLAKVVTGSQAQLELLGQIVHSIEQRIERESLSRTLGARLAPVLRDVQDDVNGLQCLINKATGSKGHSSVLKRAHIVIGGLEKQFKEHVQRIESTTKLLQLYLAESTLQFSQRSQLQNILRPCNTDYIPEKLDGTAQWLWSHETFNYWMGSREVSASSSAGIMTIDQVADRVLSIYGVKGSGKSVLASSLVQDLRSQGHVVLFFSFWAGSDEARKSISMLRCLLWQLLDTLPEEEQHIHIPRLLKKSLELTKMSSIAIELHKLCEYDGKGIYIILDGIDESADDWNDTRCGPLSILLELIQNHTSVRLLLVGRQASLRPALSKWPLSIEITKILISHDLQKLIAYELDNCPNLSDPDIRERVRKDLESRSSVMFLWIKLVFKQLRQSFCSHEINSTLNRSPNELNREYSRLFSILVRRLDGHPRSPSVGMVRAKRLLCLLIGASRPLTISELSQAYAYSFTAVSPTDLGVESYAIDREAIIHACGDIVTVQEDLVYFGHASVREFLLRPQSQWEGDDEDVGFFRLDQIECQQLLALACLRYLRNVEWHRKDNTQSLNGLASSYPLLNYATSYTLSHILSADPQFTQTSKLLAGFLNSTDLFNWMEYVFSVDNGDVIESPPLPLQFWDDLLHLLLAWDATALPEKLASSMLSPSLPDRLPPDHKLSNQDNVRVACIELMCLGSANFPACRNYVERWYDFVAEHPEKRLPLDTHKLHKIFEQMASGQKTLNITQLQLIGAKAGACLMHVKALANPLDFLFHALQKSFRSLSFLTLMACGHLAYKSNPKQALGIFEIAAEKVYKKHDLKEAWVLARLGDCLRCHDQLRDDERAEKYYNQCMDILGKIQQNPLSILGWCSAARCRVDCLLGLRRVDEAKALTKIVESRLLSIDVPVQDPNKLYSWSYSMIWGSTSMTRKRIDEALCLGSIYSFYGLNEEMERLMMPITQSEGYIKCVGQFAKFRSMNLLALAMDSQGKSSEARYIWSDARALLDPNDFHHRWHLDQTTNLIIDGLCKNGNFAEAEKEFSAFVDLPKYFESIFSEEETVQALLRNIIDTHMTNGKTSQTLQVMRGCITAIENQVTDDGCLIDQYLQTVICAALAWGVYDLAEETIRRLLRMFQTTTEWDFDQQKEAYLYEALAFSLSLQNNSKRQDPYDCYLICTALHSGYYLRDSRVRQHTEIRNTRLSIGLARACEATIARHPEAASIYDSLAGDCRNMTCCSWCIRRRYSAFFQGRALILRNKLVDAILMFSQVISEFGVWTNCGCWAGDYDNTILVTSSHLYLAELFDKCGCESQAGKSRTQAVFELRRRFYTPFEMPGRSREQSLDRLMVQWSASALEDALALCSENDQSKSISTWKQYPFETGWVLWDECGDVDVLLAMSRPGID